MSSAAARLTSGVLLSRTYSAMASSSNAASGPRMTLTLSALDQLLGLGLGGRRVAAGIGDDELRPCGRRACCSSAPQERGDALLHLDAALRERAGLHRERAYLEQTSRSPAWQSPSRRRHRRRARQEFAPIDANGHGPVLLALTRLRGCSNAASGTTPSSASIFHDIKPGIVIGAIDNPIAVDEYVGGLNDAGAVGADDRRGAWASAGRKAPTSTGRYWSRISNTRTPAFWSCRAKISPG